jgi:crossover junction endodeoxyribonuclease RuvC
MTDGPDLYIGIDPGKGGGIAATTGKLSICSKCPATVADMARLLDSLVSMGDKPFAVIEAVHSMPKQGVVSTFTFGQGYGSWLGILAALKVPYMQVTPQKWMKHYGTMPKIKKDRKHHLKHLAQQRYPELSVTLYTSDAILLAHYALSNYRVM